MPRIRIYEVRKGMHVERKSSNISKALVNKITTLIIKNGGMPKGNYYYQVPSPRLESLLREIKAMGRIKFIERKAWRVE